MSDENRLRALEKYIERLRAFEYTVPQPTAAGNILISAGTPARWTETTPTTFSSHFEALQDDAGAIMTAEIEIIYVEVPN